MELRDYLRVYWQRRWLIVTIMAIGFVVATVIAYTRPIQYRASTSFAINRINRQETTEYQYDGYYALQAGDLFAQTVVSWFSTPSIVQEMYQAGGVDPETVLPTKLPSRFRVKKYSAQNIVVRYTESTKERSEKLSAGIKQVLERRTSDLNQTSTGKSLFEIVGTAPVIIAGRLNPWVAGGLAALAGLFIGLILAAGQHYLRPS